MTTNLKRLLLAIVTIPLLGASMAFAQSAQEPPLTNHSSSSKISTLPAIFPTPVSVELGKGNVSLGKSVVVVSASTVDAGTSALITQVLKDAGVTTVKTAKKLPKNIDATYILLGTHADPAALDALKQLTTTVDTAASGYTLASKPMGAGALVALVGKDANGLYYAAQTFRQLARRAVIPAVVINDHPALPIRG